MSHKNVEPSQWSNQLSVAFSNVVVERKCVRHVDLIFRSEFCQDMNSIIPRPIKERKKHDRFNGMPEEEVSKRTLPDHLTTNLDIIIVSKPTSAYHLSDLH